MPLRRRRLPHIRPEGEVLFITGHLYGSLPHTLYLPPHKQNAGQALVWMDRYHLLVLTQTELSHFMVTLKG
jgi:hypothetical protein